MQTEISGNFFVSYIFCFTYFVFCVFVSLTAVRISRSVYFFTSNVLLIQVYLRSGNSQRLVAVVFPVYKLCITKNLMFSFPFFESLVLPSVCKIEKFTNRMDGNPRELLRDIRSLPLIRLDLRFVSLQE